MKSLYIEPSIHNNHFKTKQEEIVMLSKFSKIISRLRNKPKGVRPIGKKGKFIPIPKASFIGKKKHSFQLSRQGADLLIIERFSGHSIKTGF